MQIPTVENKKYKTNNLAQSTQAMTNKGKETYDVSTSFLGNDDFVASNVCASTKITDTKKKATEIWNEIENSKSIAILTHKFPDGDALGSGLALLNTLRQNFPDKEIDFITPGNFPKYLKGLPGTELIIIDKNLSPAINYDLAIAVDCDEGLMDGLDIYKAAIKRINIDHHGTNINLNKNTDNNILLIDKKAPSATDVIYNKLLKPLNIVLSASTAECLLTGLLTDSGCFRYAQDPQKAKETSAELLNAINKTKNYTTDTIMMKLDNNRKESDELKNLSKHLLEQNNIKTIISKNGKKINYVILGQDTLKSFNVTDNNLEIKLMVDKLTDRLKDGSGIGMVFWETGDPNEIRVSVKSRKFIVDDLALKNGGGGHKHAAGFGLIGEKNEVITEFLSNLKDYQFSAE